MLGKHGKASGYEERGEPGPVEKSARGRLGGARVADRRNLRLMLSVVQKFVVRGERMGDLLQVGCIGILKDIGFRGITKMGLPLLRQPLPISTHHRNTPAVIILSPPLWLLTQGRQ